MTFAVLLGTVLASQIVFVSIYFPRRVANAALGVSPRSSHEEIPQRLNLKLYATLNNVIAAVGLLFIVLCITLQSQGVVTGLLLCIGLFFLLQMSTLAVLFRHGALPAQRTTPGLDQSTQNAASGAVGLFNILPLVPVIIAAGLYISYVFVICIQWDRFEGSQISKLVAITLTNLVFVSTVLWHYGKLKNGPAEKAAERYWELTRMAPTIVFGSILVTVYFFMKEIMFGLDLHELRPTMMSVFLQLIAIAVFHALLHVDADNRTIA